MKIRLSGQARQYLREEAAYLRRHSTHAATGFRNRIAASLENLAEFPELGRDTRDLPIPGNRRLIAGDYVLDYDLADEMIVIVAIRHSRQMDDMPDTDDDFDYENG